MRKNMYYLLVMPLVVCWLFSTPMLAQQKKSTELKIVTWNIQMLPNSMAMFSAALRKKQRIREPWISEHCNQADYDVIVFQEVFDKQIKRKLKNNLKEKYPYQVDTRTTKGRLTSNGVFFVSKVPMRYIDHVIYAKGEGSDGWAAKGCTLVEVEKDGLVFQIAGTHLQSGGSEVAQLHRDSQYLDMRCLMEWNKSDSKPVFVMGDMNTRKTATDRYNRMLSSLGVVDFPLDEERPYTIDGQNSWNNHTKGIQLDYIFLQKRATNTTILEQTVLRPTQTHKGKVIDLADHYGVVARIRVEN